MRINGRTPRRAPAGAAVDPVADLARRLRDIEARSALRNHASARCPSIPFPGTETILTWATIHEWTLAGMDRLGWIPPLLILSHLARSALQARHPHTIVLWVGQRCWPYPLGLGDGGLDLLRRSIFLDTPDHNARLWAIDLALRSPAVAVVVADGSGLDMAASRRLQLAAEAGGAMGLLARPEVEIRLPSTAATRWKVCPVPSPALQPRWALQLLRCRGARARNQTRTWIVERDRAQGLVVVPADVGDRSGETAPATGAPARRTA